MKTRKSNKPQLIDETSGALTTSFKFNRKEVYESCGVTHENKQYIFGGNKNTRQILQLSDCGMTDIGTLEFDFKQGACGSTPNDMILLCFTKVTVRQCQQASSPLGVWKRQRESTYEHRRTAIAPSEGQFILLIDIEIYF